MADQHIYFSFNITFKYLKRRDWKICIYCCWRNLRLCIHWVCLILILILFALSYRFYTDWVILGCSQPQYWICIKHQIVFLFRLNSFYLLIFDRHILVEAKPKIYAYQTQSALHLSNSIKCKSLRPSNYRKRKRRCKQNQNNNKKVGRAHIVSIK